MNNERENPTPHSNGRREFLKTAAMTLGAVFVSLPVISALDGCGGTGLKAGNTAPQIGVDVSSLTEGAASLVTSDVGPDGAPILIHRISANQYEAHSMKCTHKGCVVGEPDQTGIANCPCHGAQYDLNGRVLTGPAQYDLHPYRTAYNSQTKILTVKFS
ncbi:MAG: Rieske 2Fe-2S domain-containing protein [Bacteroidota bacterium]|nr:Rieske 2Fe-2S domain-containing protein [Bacteroidota bacterium]MDP4236762.1 Rieske 2Fe-2S domain-containing protein [Bacteroidota bacterium]